MSSRSFTRPPACTACRRACSLTTALCSPPPPARARSCCNPSYSGSASRSRTPGPTTPRPAARSSACTRPSSATWHANPSRERSESCKAQLDTFAHYYNDIRPHRALEGRTPLQAYTARVKARPTANATPGTHFRVREDKIDRTGTVTVRYMSKLHHIGIGRAHKGRPIKLLIADRNIRVIDHQTGELLRALTLDPSRDYQPIGKT